MTNFMLFTHRLVLAVNSAESTPEPSKEVKQKTLKVLKAGLRPGQQRIVVMTYNSVLSSIEFDKKYNSDGTQK